jgi:APA family basic amino acid/polyamine antiporter
MTKLNRSLGVWTAASIVVGSIIGTGIFMKTTAMTMQLGSQSYVMLAWIISGVLSFAGALTYAELCSYHSDSGGEYALLKESFGPLSAFLYGWQRFLIASPGSIAAYAVGSATFLAGVSNLEAIGGIKGASILFIVVFSAINCLHVATGGKVQTFLTILKVLLVLFLGLGLFIFLPAAETSADADLSLAGTFSISSFGMAMIAALWAFDGWNNLPMVGEEIENPQRNFPIAMGIGMAIVLVLYLLANSSFFHALSLDEILSANSSANPDALPVATLAAQKWLGGIGVPLLSIAFVISALGAMNGSILTASRVPFAMSRDGFFFKGLSSVNAKTQVPMVSIIVQAIVSIILAMLGTFDQLTDYVVVASWLFYALVTASIFKFRKTHKNSTSKFRVPLYPIVPILFIGASAFLIINSIMTGADSAIKGGLIIACGIPVYYFFKKKNNV